MVSEHVKQNETQRVDVRLEPVAFVTLDLLWWGIEGSTQTGGKIFGLGASSLRVELLNGLLLVVLLLHVVFLLSCQSFGQAKITQTSVLVVVQKDILRFDVSVQYITLVNEIDGL